MVNPDNNLYVFGPYTLNAREGILLRNGHRVPLQPKVFETLLILVKRHGHFVSKDELMQLIWPDTFVEEINLAKNISILRKTLANGDNSREFIETLPKRGYRFALLVEIIDAGDEADLRESGAAPPRSDRSTKLRKYGQPAIAGSLFLVMVLIGFYGKWRWNRPSVSTRPEGNLNIGRLTNSSQVFDAAISPDGRWLAFTLGEGGRQSLWLKDLKNSLDSQLLPQFEGHYRGLNFSPDSRFVYYSRREKNHFDHTLYRMARTGGEPQAIIKGVDSTISFAPDEVRFAFVRDDEVVGESSLIIAGTDGRKELKLATRRSPEFYSVDGPAWSPDGKMIAVALASSTNGFNYRVMLISSSDGNEKPLGNQLWAWVMRVQWLSDGSGVVLAGRDKHGTTNNQIWQVTYPDGIGRRVVTDHHDYRNLSVTSNGKAIVTIQSEVRANIWVAPINSSGKAEAFDQITSTPTSQCGYNGLDWTPDGRLVYTAYANDQKNLWIMHPDGSQSRQLSFDMIDIERPSVCGDGRFIVFTSMRSGSPHIWRIDLDGGNPKKLTSGNLDLTPACSPDGKWVIYSSEKTGARTISKVGIEGGPALSLSNKLTAFPAISPDGRLIASLYQESVSAPRKNALLAAEGGAHLRFIDIPVFARPTVQWHPSGQALGFLDQKDDSTNIWLQPIENGQPVRVTDFNYERIFEYSWSRDGRYLAVSRGVINRDVVIIRGFN